MPVRITIDGQSFLTDDLTVDEAVGIERATGVSWLQLNPLVSADHCRAVMVAFLSRQIPEEEAATWSTMTCRTPLRTASQIRWAKPRRPDRGLRPTLPLAAGRDPPADLP
jgi:hypothetical protein